MKKILNFGSLNIDHVYKVPWIVVPGQTLASSAYAVFAGGKGANQSAALAKAGARVFHAGRIGEDGRHLLTNLQALGVDTRWTVVDPGAKTGHAVIQVDESSGENAILLHPGANHDIRFDQIRDTFDCFPSGSILLLQNEVNMLDSLLTEGRKRGFDIVWNPAPVSNIAPDLLQNVDLLVVNESEAFGICGESGEPKQIIAALRQTVPDRMQLLLTLGPRGAILDRPHEQPLRVSAYDAGPVVDTTGAGDTFIGYFLAARAGGAPDQTALHLASAAAALCVTQAGAQSSIPDKSQVDAQISSMRSVDIQ